MFAFYDRRGISLGVLVDWTLTEELNQHCTLGRIGRRVCKVHSRKRRDGKDGARNGVFAFAEWQKAIA